MRIGSTFDSHCSALGRQRKIIWVLTWGTCAPTLYCYSLRVLCVYVSVLSCVLLCVSLSVCDCQKESLVIVCFLPTEVDNVDESKAKILIIKGMQHALPQDVASLSQLSQVLKLNICPSLAPVSVVVVSMASDSDSDEDFVTYGTPLEPLEEGKTHCIHIMGPTLQSHILINILSGRWQVSDCHLACILD